LYFQVREFATGHDERTILDLAAAKDLALVEADELQQRLRREFVPAHAVLAIAGDLRGVNLRSLIENEFGKIPAGDPLPPAPPRPLKPSRHRLVRAQVGHPIGVVGVIAPALTDSLHPQFFLSLLIIGQQVKSSWQVDPLLKSRFSYSILEEPDLIRFYPAAAPESLSATELQ